MHSIPLPLSASVAQLLEPLAEPPRKKPRLKEAPYVPLPDFNYENSASDLSSGDEQEQTFDLRSDREVQELNKLRRQFNL